MSNSGQLEALLRGRIKGYVRFDPLYRSLYATDASMYEQVPIGVAMPRDVADVVQIVRCCREVGVSITARGAGTGLTGGAVGEGLQVDFSRYMNRILEVDPQRRIARVQPGVVLDVLNARLGGCGLQFAPDVATSSRATIGGMIANNSCGAHSGVYGTTADHVESLTLVLSDGSVVTWSAMDPASWQQRCRGDSVEAVGLRTIQQVLRDHAGLIRQRYPKLLRCNGGYGLDRLLQDDLPNPTKLVCGSEGTLGLVVEATLRLTPLPTCRAVLVAHFHDLMESLSAVSRCLEHSPAAVELIDQMILDASADNPALARRRGFLRGRPKAILAIEFLGQDRQDLLGRLQQLQRALEAAGLGYAFTSLTDSQAQLDLWEVRKAGLGLLMSRPGDRQPYAFIEDTAVDPTRLREFHERLDELLKDEGVEDVGRYGHGSAGCIHIRPVLNLKDARDIGRMRRIAERVSDLVAHFGGAMTAEHGDGYVRSCWAEKIYGPEIVRAFGQIKRAFDPEGLLNPGKIVDPPEMTANLRYGPDYKSGAPPSKLDFSAYGGLAGMVEMCSGVAQCRQNLVGTMCPSYQATGDEKDTTRARANALRIALSNRTLLEGFDDARLEEVMDLCLSCKACRAECPTGVDMARIKAEWLYHRQQKLGTPRRSKLIAAVPRLARWGSRFAPLSSWLIRSAPARWLLQKYCGLDRRMPLPRFARQSFERWFARRRPEIAAPARGRVVFFVDTWTNYYVPAVGRAAVLLLEAAGYEVIVPRRVCCGRPMISKGLLDQAQANARRNIELLIDYARQGLPIVGVEPSCMSTFIDEYPQLVPGDDAELLARQVRMVDAFLADLLGSEPAAIKFTNSHRRILFHGHCHQKALMDTAASLALLNAPPGYQATEINSGCCGMAGSFGHEVEHYDVARLVGQQRLFPAVRNRGDADIAVCGFSCRTQIEHHTDARPRHVLEIVAEALAR